MAKQSLYDALTEHIVSNQEKYYRAAWYYVKNREAALDVVQNAIIKALEKYDTIQSVEAMPAWFYRIVINEALMYLRREKKYIPWDEEESDLLEGVYVEEAYEPKTELAAGIEQLPTEMQIVIQLHFFEDKTLKEIAEITGTNLNTVKSRLYSACRKLGKQLEEEDSELVTRHSKDKAKKAEKTGKGASKPRGEPGSAPDAPNCPV